MSQYVVKFFEINPFDKSEHAKNVQVLCDKITEEPFAVIKNDFDLVEETISENQIKADWVSKKSKHIVAGDAVVFGEFNKYEGFVIDIVENEEYDKDILYITGVKSSLSKVPALAALYKNRVEAKEMHVERRSVNVKPWIVAELIDKSFALKKLKSDFFDFIDKEPTKEEQYDWWIKKIEKKL